MKELLSFKGAASRFEWWMTSLVADLFIQLGVVFLMLYFSGGSFIDVVLGVLIAGATVLFLWAAIVVIVRRLRERERLWQIVLLALIPYLGWIWIIVECGFLRSPSKAVKKKLVRRTIKS